MLLPRGVGLEEFLRTAKIAFAEAASDQIRSQGDRVSASRIAVITGLPRAEVAKIRSSHESPVRVRGQQRTARVMHGWFTDADFVDAEGNPKALPAKGAVSFERLVKKFAGDVPPKAVLRELVAAGMVELGSGGRALPLRRHSKATGLSATDLESLATDISVLLSSAFGASDTSTATRRRVAVAFRKPVSAAVRRNVAVRAERFLDALSEYLHAASDAAYRSPSDERERVSFQVVLAQSETDAAEPSNGARPR